MKVHSLLFFVLLACSGDDEDSANKEQNPANSTDSDTTTESSQETAENPVITEANAWCYPGSNSGEQWMFQMYVEDPQGEENLSNMMNDAAALYDAGGNIVGNSFPVVLYPDGSYTGSANLSVACAQAANFEARFIAVDLDGNMSEEMSVQAYEGTSAAGK